MAESKKPDVVLPGPTLTVVQPEPHFSMAPKDFRRVYRNVDGLRRPIPYAANLGWAFVGITVSLGLFLLGWIFNQSALPPSVQADLRWVVPALVVAGLASICVVVICFVMDHAVEKELRIDVDDVLRDMDEIWADSHGPSQHIHGPEE
jgi:hypothetical protein